MSAESIRTMIRATLGTCIVAAVTFVTMTPAAFAIGGVGGVSSDHPPAVFVPSVPPGHRGGPVHSTPGGRPPVDRESVLAHDVFHALYPRPGGVRQIYLGIRGDGREWSRRSIGRLSCDMGETRGLFAVPPIYRCELGKNTWTNDQAIFDALNVPAYNVTPSPARDGRRPRMWDTAVSEKRVGSLVCHERRETDSRASGRRPTAECWLR